MKFLFALVAFLLLYVSCIPCSDTKECNVQVEAKISTADNHQQHDHASESCSPFCTCSCCAVAGFCFPVSKLQINKITFQSSDFQLYDIIFHTEAHYSIWQPPKLA